MFRIIMFRITFLKEIIGLMVRNALDLYVNLEITVKFIIFSFSIQKQRQIFMFP